MDIQVHKAHPALVDILVFQVIVVYQDLAVNQDSVDIVEHQEHLVDRALVVHLDSVDYPASQVLVVTLEFPVLVVHLVFLVIADKLELQALVDLLDSLELQALVDIQVILVSQDLVDTPELAVTLENLVSVVWLVELVLQEHLDFQGIVEFQVLVVKMGL